MNPRWLLLATLLSSCSETVSRKSLSFTFLGNWPLVPWVLLLPIFEDWDVISFLWVLRHLFWSSWPFKGDSEWNSNEASVPSVLADASHQSHKSKTVNVKFDIMVSNSILLSQRRVFFPPGLLSGLLGQGFPKGWAWQKRMKQRSIRCLSFLYYLDCECSSSIQ